MSIFTKRVSQNYNPSVSKIVLNSMQLLGIDGIYSMLEVDIINSYWVAFLQLTVVTLGQFIVHFIIYTCLFMKKHSRHESNQNCGELYGNFDFNHQNMLGVYADNNRVI